MRQVRKQAGHQQAAAGKWFCFDDNTVEPWDVNTLERECFGGKYVLEPGFDSGVKGTTQVCLLVASRGLG